MYKREKPRGRDRRRVRVRKKVFGTSERPRLSVFRSSKHMFVQLIDDDKGITLAAVSSQSAAVVSENNEGGKKVGIANAVGVVLAGRAKDKGVTKVVFDRGGYLYHGRVRAVAEGARSGGLVF